jgi:hypothetical protein
VVMWMELLRFEVVPGNGASSLLKL